MCRLVFVFYVFFRNSGSKYNRSLLQLPFCAMAFKGASGYSTWVTYTERVLLKRQIPVLSSKQSKHSLFVERRRMEVMGEGEMFGEPAVATHWRGRCLPVPSRLPLKLCVKIQCSRQGNKLKECGPSPGAKAFPGRHIASPLRCLRKAPTDRSQGAVGQQAPVPPRQG